MFPKGERRVQRGQGERPLRGQAEHPDQGPDYPVSLFAEVERGPILGRTREGLAKARTSDKKFGCPNGSFGVSRMDGNEDEIRQFIELGVSKSAIAKITRVSPSTLYNFMQTRRLRTGR